MEGSAQLPRNSCPSGCLGSRPQTLVCLSGVIFTAVFT
jgi:hypothetical protein